MKARKFEPVTVVCDDCGQALAETHGTPYMEGTIVIRPELVRTHGCPGKPPCTCTGVGLRVKLAVLTGFVEHAADCKAAGRAR